MVRGCEKNVSGNAIPLETYNAPDLHHRSLFNVPVTPQLLLLLYSRNSRRQVGHVILDIRSLPCACYFQ